MLFKRSKSKAANRFDFDATYFTPLERPLLLMQVMVEKKERGETRIS